MKGKKCFGLLLVLSTIFGLSLSVSLNVSAASVSETYRNFLWNSNQYATGVYTLYEPGTRSIGSPLYTGAFRIGRLQFSFPVSMNNLHSNTVLSVQFQLQGVPGGNLTYGFNSNMFNARLNPTGYKVNNGGCTVSAVSSTLVNFSCDYNITPDGSSISQIWVDLGNLGIESGVTASEQAFWLSSNSGGSLNFNYLLYSYQTSPSYSEQQNQTMIQQNQEIIQQQRNIYDKIDDVGSDINNTLEQQQQQDNQDRDNINQASDDANNSSNSSQQQAEQTGTTLLKAFTDFVGALTNARPSNCNLDMDLGNLDMGVVNLCSLSPPPVFQTIASIFMILFCVPLSIATARKVINLFRSFQ